MIDARDLIGAETLEQVERVSHGGAASARRSARICASSFWRRKVRSAKAAGLVSSPISSEQPMGRSGASKAPKDSVTKTKAIRR